MDELFVRAELDAAAPPELEAILRKALAKNVDERYQTGGQFAAALADYLAARALN